MNDDLSENLYEEWLAPQESDKPPFTEQEYADRLRCVRQIMAKDKINLLHVTSPENMFYLHNYRARWYTGQSPTTWTGMTCTFIHVDNDYMIHFDAPDHQGLIEATSIVKEKRYYPKSDWYGNPDTARDKLEILIKELKAFGWLKGTVGMEFYSHVPNRVISGLIEEAFKKEGCNVVDATKILRKVRRVKSPREIAYTEEAARIADIGHSALKEAIRPGVTELELYGEAVRAMYAAGGEPSAIVGNVGIGPDQSSHGLMGRRKVTNNQHLYYDPCGVYNGYHANVCRGYWVGEPSKDTIDLYKFSGGAFDVLSKVAKAGISISEVNKALRDYYGPALSENLGLPSGARYAMGYELGVAFPPDWVGEFYFSVLDKEPAGSFIENEVTNFESVIDTALIDTFIYEKDGARRLSSIKPELIILNE